MVQIVSPQKPMHATCYKCKARLEYVFTEIKTKTTTDYTDGRDVVKYIVCPVCNNHVPMGFI